MENFEELKNNLVQAFHQLYYSSATQTWQNTFFHGLPILKCPLDLWIYQELIFRLKPDYIIETGSFCFGSASYLLSICDQVGKGKVITIDVEKRIEPPKHPRLEFILASSTCEKTMESIKRKIQPSDTVLVILDSEHKKEHVDQEINLYHPLVSLGSYLIVEDTNINNHPVHPNFGPGPMESVEQFLKENDDFEIDKSCEKFFLTFNPNGFLKRIK